MPKNQLKTGDLLIYKGRGALFQILSRLLWLFNKKWNRWGWHTALVYSKAPKGYFILEAAVGGVQINLLPCHRLGFDVKPYTWLPVPPAPAEMFLFMSQRIDSHYDAECYFFSALQYLLKHLGVKTGRIKNRKYTCWELCFEFFREMEMPVQVDSDYPIITDFLKAFKEA